MDQKITDDLTISQFVSQVASQINNQPPNQHSITNQPSITNQQLPVSDEFNDDIDSYMLSSHLNNTSDSMEDKEDLKRQYNEGT